MPKGKRKDLSAFDALTRVGVVAGLARKIARTVAGYPVDIVNEALTLATREPLREDKLATAPASVAPDQG